jgi:hypothetical protein
VWSLVPERMVVDSLVGHDPGDVERGDQAENALVVVEHWDRVQVVLDQCLSARAQVVVRMQGDPGRVAEVLDPDLRVAAQALGPDPRRVEGFGRFLRSRPHCIPPLVESPCSDIRRIHSRSGAWRRQGESPSSPAPVAAAPHGDFTPAPGRFEAGRARPKTTLGTFGNRPVRGRRPTRSEGTGACGRGRCHRRAGSRRPCGRAVLG